MRYIVNSPCLKTPGLYEYRALSPDDAREWLQAAPFISTIRFSETARLLERWSGASVPLSKQTIILRAGDEALVFRLVDQSVTPPAGELTPEFLAAHCEIGLLRFLARRKLPGRGRVSGDSHGRAKLTKQQIEWARQRKEEGKPVTWIAEQLGVDRSTLYYAFRGQTWKE